MEKFTTRRSSLHSAIIQEPVIIYETKTTRCIFSGYINDTKTETRETLGGIILHQRKNLKNEWEDFDAINLATLKGGQGVRIRFRSEQLRKLFLGLKKLYAISEKGIYNGETEFTVGQANEIIQVPSDRKMFITQLLSEDYGEEVWREILKKKPDLATRLSFARINSKRIESLNEFKDSLDSDKPENYWQKYFSNNEWIFGYGLKYYFLTQLSEQPYLGGINFDGKGSQKGDFLLNTVAEIKFTVLVEIKRPDTYLLSRNTKGVPIRYRNGAYLLSEDLLGGVSQIQVNCTTWAENCFSPANYEKLRKRDIFTISPKGILIIGNTKELVTVSESQKFG